MTLNAQTFVTGTAQIILVESAITGIMAGDTGHRLTIPWIVSRISGWVVEIIMFFVTVDTGLVVPPFEHRWFFCSMELMTIEAAVSIGVEVATVFAANKFSGMALLADFSGVTTN